MLLCDFFSILLCYSFKFIMLYVLHLFDHNMVRFFLFLKYVPAAFAEHLASKSGYIELCDSNGKKWLVRFTRNIKPNENNLSSGWATVLKEKSLKVGDTCVFELIDINKLMLKVFTFCNTSTARIKQSSS